VPAWPDEVLETVPADHPATDDGVPVLRALRGTQLSGQLLRHPLVVVVEERDPLSPRFVDRQIPRVGVSKVPVGNDDPKPRFGDRIERFQGLGVPAVDHDKHLERSQRLRKRAVDRPEQQVRTLERRDDYGDERRAVRHAKRLLGSHRFR